MKKVLQKGDRLKAQTIRISRLACELSHLLSTLLTNAKSLTEEDEVVPHLIVVENILERIDHIRVLRGQIEKGAIQCKDQFIPY